MDNDTSPEVGTGPIHETPAASIPVMIYDTYEQAIKDGAIIDRGPDPKYPYPYKKSVAVHSIRILDHETFYEQRAIGKDSKLHPDYYEQVLEILNERLMRQFQQ
jgi:hypothetical protein